MDPMQVMSELIGYPFVGPSCKAVIKVVQQFQANVVTKDELLSELETIKNSVKGKDANLPEHQKFNSALDEIVNNLK